MGERARNGLPGGVQKNRPIGSRFRATAGILLPTEGHFGLLRPNLSLSFNIKSIKIDHNQGDLMTLMMYYHNRSSES